MSNNKILIMPKQFSGSMVLPKHSKKLEIILKNFITVSGGHYYDDEISKGIISSYYKLKNEISIEQQVHIRQSDYVCYTTLSIHIDHNDINSVLKYIHISNDINTKLDYGNFEVDVNTGDITYRTYYEPIDTIQIDSIDKMLGYPRHVINKYGHLFLREI